MLISQGCLAITNQHPISKISQGDASGLQSAVSIELPRSPREVIDTQTKNANFKEMDGPKEERYRTSCLKSMKIETGARCLKIKEDVEHA
jgi:hypothetical protein